MPFLQRIFAPFCAKFFSGIRSILEKNLTRNGIKKSKWKGYVCLWIGSWFDLAAVVYAYALHPDQVADFYDVFDFFDSEVSKLGDVHEAVLAREDFDEGSEFLDGDYGALVGFADGDFLGHAFDDLLGTLERFAVARVDVDGAVVFDVDFPCDGAPLPLLSRRRCL